MKRTFIFVAMLTLTITTLAAGADIVGPPDDPFDFSRVQKLRLSDYSAFGDTSVTISQLDQSGFPRIDLYVDVLDENGLPLWGLGTGDFCLTQDGQTVPFTISQIEAAGCARSIALVIDVSGSMNLPEHDPAIGYAKAAAHAFVDDMDDYDRVAIIAFSDCADVVQEFTSDKQALHDAIDGLRAEGMTALFDGIWLGVNEAVSELGSKAVIFFADGLENNSDVCEYPPNGLFMDNDYTDDSTLICDLARSAGIPVYAVGVGENVWADPMIAFAEGTGGYYQFAPSAADLGDIFTEIRERLCNRYLISYDSPDTQADGDWHEVIVCVFAPDCQFCDTAHYRENLPPAIAEDPATIALASECQPPDEELTICALVSDDVEPYVTNVKLFYRVTGEVIYTTLPMTQGDPGQYCAAIPDISLPEGGGIDYYITASDGMATVSLPSQDPQNNPYRIALCPNDPPGIAHEPPSCVYGSDVTITATVVDNTDFVELVRLYYRIAGSASDYDSVDFTADGADQYSAVVPGGFATESGIDYLIYARDNWGFFTTYGPIVVNCEDTLTCWPDLPAPELVMECVEEVIVNDTRYHRFHLGVTNWADFPDTLFWPAPDLEPCGDNTEASRSWIDIYDNEDNRINGFCALGHAADLDNIWFGIPLSGTPPDSVYITITDRRCDIVYTSNLVATSDAVAAPVITCPGMLNDTVVAPGTEICIEVPIDGDFTLGNGDEYWADGHVCFTPTQSMVYEFLVIAANECGVDSCEFSIDVTVADTATVIPTWEWIYVLCPEPVFNGVPLTPGDTIRAYDPQGVLCGMDVVKPEGHFGFMFIYRDDPWTDWDEGADIGDTIQFTLNGDSVFTDPVVVWTEMYARYELCSFYTEFCRQLTLTPGWNLISWNVDYSDDLQDFIAPFAECVDIVMSFDGGGLTYDPDLPDFSTLWNVDYHYGYWLRSTCEVTVDICGLPIEPGEVLGVNKGWNVIPYWPQDSLPVEDALSSVMEDLVVTLGFRDGYEIFQPDGDRFSTLEYMVPLYGYWLKMEVGGALDYFGSSPLATWRPHRESTVAADYGLTATRQWVSVYGSALTLDGQPIADGAVLEFVSAEGARCGHAVYRDQRLRFTPVYGNDSDMRSYPEAGEEVRLVVDGREVFPSLTWTSHGDRIELPPLFSGTDGAPAIARTWHLDQNYPNPFNPTTQITFGLGQAGFVRLEIFNVLGQRIRTLVNAETPAGEHTALWDGRDDNGQMVSSGVYLYRLESGPYSNTRKMLMLK
jgi:VWFA-related protein